MAIETDYYEKKTPTPTSVFWFVDVEKKQITPAGRVTSSARLPSLKKAPKAAEWEVHTRYMMGATFTPTAPPAVRKPMWSNELSAVVLTSALVAAIIMSVGTFKDDYFNFSQYPHDTASFQTALTQVVTAPITANAAPAAVISADESSNIETFIGTFRPFYAVFSTAFTAIVRSIAATVSRI